YDVRRMEQGLLDITNQLGAIGYAFVDINPEINTDPETEALSINISIGKARKNFVERIEIIDNSRTQDRVIRRQMELAEGDAFNQLKLDRSVRNIRNLGYFSNVSVRNLVGSSPEQTVTEVTVEEQSTGEFSIGLGYSTLDKTSFTVGINERNFLGTGRSLEATLSTSDSRTDFRVGTTEPYLFGRNLLGSAAFFKERLKRSTATVDQTGFDLGVGFSAAGDIYHRVGYEVSQSKVSNTSTKATSVTGENGKTILKSAVNYSISKDTRDNRIDPTEGYLLRSYQEVAGLGGDATYAKVVINGAHYQSFFFNSVVLGFKGRYGTVSGLGEKVTQSQRFFLGGRDVRGFAGGGIGPRDTGTKGAVGGNNVYSGSAEIVSDLGLSSDLGLRWTVFTDVGSTWGTDFPTGVTKPNDSSMRTSVGFGFLWDTILGPLSFYWADAVDKQPHDNLKRFQLAIGARL
ncbi:outer membrane protein assembly factor BamA, partial [Alphaproteobacteria bacterium]|nr:outer membrane protein assembly factor BamA [Alphaproteobacteria bacterium]